MSAPEGFLCTGYPRKWQFRAGAHSSMELFVSGPLYKSTICIWELGRGEATHAGGFCEVIFIMYLGSHSSWQFICVLRNTGVAPLLPSLQ